jgi:membrane-associated phospholipid phosphatase
VSTVEDDAPNDAIAGSAPSGSPRRLAATVVTEAFSPAIIVVLLSLAVAWHATGYRVGPTFGWGLVVAVFSSVAPMVFIVTGARKGRWDGHHVRNREGRLIPLTLCGVFTAAGLAILIIGHAPRDLIALDVAMLGTLIVCLAITQAWKVSIHTAVLGGAVVTVVLLYGAWLSLLALLVVLVGWSRVQLSDHTVAQTIAGGLVGPIVGGVIFLLVR